MNTAQSQGGILSIQMTEKMNGLMEMVVLLIVTTMCPVFIEIMSGS